MDKDLKKTKEELLTEKINLLAEKIKGETNIPRKTLYIIKVRMVQEELNREIEIRRLQAKYDNERLDREDYAEGEKSIIRDEIYELNSQIKELEEYLKLSDKYNFRSENFIDRENFESCNHRDEYIEFTGPEEIDEEKQLRRYIKVLRLTGLQRNAETADKIEEYENLRRELSYKKIDLQRKEKEIEFINEKTKFNNNESIKEEQAIIKSSEGNGFSKIVNFFKHVGYGIKEVWNNISTSKKAKSKAKREAKTENKAQKRAARQEMKEEFFGLMRRYKDRMAELKKEYNMAVENVNKEAKVQTADTKEQEPQATGEKSVVTQGDNKAEESKAVDKKSKINIVNKPSKARNRYISQPSQTIASNGIIQIQYPEIERVEDFIKEYDKVFDDDGR